MGEALDALKERWEEGDIGSIVFIYERRKANTVKADWVLLPGTSWIEAMGWARLLVHDLLEWGKS